MEDQQNPEESRSPAIAWTIAGLDPSSGAGVTADLMTFAAHAVFGCSAVTALTVQSTLGVAETEPVGPAIFAATLDHLLADLPPAGVKIGMLGTPAHARITGELLGRLRPGREFTSISRPFAVMDPVLRSSSGRELYPADALGVLHESLLPEVDVVTPNWGELALLAGMDVSDRVEAEAAARSLRRRHPRLSVIVTGGDQVRPADLVMTAQGQTVWLEGEHIESRATHGTGCAFSSALLCGLIAGSSVQDAARDAKRYVAEAIRQAPNLGAGVGPMGLFWPLAPFGARS